MKLNCTHQLLVYADDINILGGSVHSIKENAEAFLVASKGIGLEVNADKTKSHQLYIFIFFLQCVFSNQDIYNIAR